MEKHKIDENRDMTYKSGVSLDADTTPNYIKKTDNKKKKE